MKIKGMVGCAIMLWLGFPLVIACMARLVSLMGQMF